MAINDKNVTIIGASTVVVGVHIYPRAGGFEVTADGYALDSLGNKVPLTEYRISLTPGQFSAVDTMASRALTELRKANGLET